ncbi:glycosyltransferase [Flavobacterium sp.]|jgi:glycosyltransferase involved in cell wall biosynthesis|uniref:glycosyltransferase n=1 Tax=Flavobacterium sp. TaxID=239 RepID=UPI0037BE3798
MKNNNKIAIVSASLGVGGAERFAGLLSFMLHDLGYEVHNIIILDHVDYDYKGTLVNLGELFAKEKGIFRAIKKGKHIAKYLYENDIQIVIDNRSRPLFIREVFTKWIYGKREIYFMVHSSNLDMYFSIWSNFLYKNSAKLVCVSRDIENKIRQKFNFNNTITIYNPIVFPESIVKKPIDIPEQYLLFFGRLEEEIKNFTLLLSAFSRSKVYDNGVKLLIIGNGASKDFIFKKIKELQLENHVQLVPFQKNIVPYVQNARCSILTSRFEGFPMAIIESLSIGTPVVSVDCESGPSEIIKNKYNGLLVANHDEVALAKAIKSMFLEENLYHICKNNAQESVEHLSLKTISKEWKHLLAKK